MRDHLILSLFVSSPFIAERVELVVFAFLLESDLDPFVLLAHWDSSFSRVDFKLPAGFNYFERGNFSLPGAFAVGGDIVNGPHDHLVAIAVAVGVNSINADIRTVAAFLDGWVALACFRTPLTMGIAIAQHTTVHCPTVVIVDGGLHITVISNEAVRLHVGVDGGRPHSIGGLEFEVLGQEGLLHLRASSIGGLVPRVAEVVA